MDQSSVTIKNLQESIHLKKLILQDQKMLESVALIAEKIVATFRNDGKLLFCGNGGSAADSQHLAAEFSGRYYYDRPPLYSEALHVNTSYITAIANDYSFEDIYSRIIQAIGKKGDVLVGLSTSGNSKNVVNALSEAKKRGMLTIAFTGEGGGEMKKISDLTIEIPSMNTPRIQECHMLIGHSICEIVEQVLFPQ